MTADQIVLPLTATMSHYAVYTHQRDGETIIECDRCPRRTRLVGRENDWDTMDGMLRLIAEHEADHHLDDPDLPQFGHPSA